MKIQAQCVNLQQRLISATEGNNQKVVLQQNDFIHQVDEKKLQKVRPQIITSKTRHYIEGLGGLGLES